MAEIDNTTGSNPSRLDPFGPTANADETRQAQHQNANDTPTDVNMNAVVARSQALTFDIAGKNFQQNSARLDALMNHEAAKLAAK